MNIYIYVAKKESCVIKYISKNYIIVNCNRYMELINYD